MLQTPGNMQQSQPQSLRHAECKVDQHIDWPTGIQSKWGAERDRSGALQMVTSMVMLASIDEWKNQSDIYTHQIWCSHVNSQLWAERWLTGVLLTEKQSSMSVLMLVAYAIDGSLELSGPSVCARSWRQRFTAKCMWNQCLMQGFLQATEVEVFCQDYLPN